MKQIREVKSWDNGCYSIRLVDDDGYYSIGYRYSRRDILSDFLWLF